jgi:hypothetical protein
VDDVGSCERLIDPQVPITKRDRGEVSDPAAGKEIAQGARADRLELYALEVEAVALRP